MIDFLPWIAVGANMTALAINLRAAKRYSRKLKELSNGHRQDRQDSGSVSRALSIGAPGERAGGAVAPSETGVSPEPVDQEIIGWRSWGVEVEQDGFGAWTIRLVGMYAKPWDGPTMTADVLPEPQNYNGVYARPMDWWERERAKPFYSYSIPNPPNPSPVQGSVALTGRVLEGERGWRAERATIRELWVVGTLPLPTFQVRQQLEDRYKCEVHCDAASAKAIPFSGWLYT